MMGTSYLFSLLIIDMAYQSTLVLRFYQCLVFGFHEKAVSIHIQSEREAKKESNSQFGPVEDLRYILGKNYLTLPLSADARNIESVSLLTGIA